jgi:hypothetical protein
VCVWVLLLLLLLRGLARLRARSLSGASLSLCSRNLCAESELAGWLACGLPLAEASTLTSLSRLSPLTTRARP